MTQVTLYLFQLAVLMVEVRNNPYPPLVLK